MLRTRLIALTVLSVLVLVASQVLELGGGDDDRDERSQPTVPPTTSTTARPRPRPTTTTTAPPCRPDGRSVKRGGINVREFCGPARAVLHVGAEVYDMRGGTCRLRRKWFQLSIGSVVLETRPAITLNPRFSSFSMLVGRHPASVADRAPAPDDGTYNEGDVSFTVPGAAYAMKDVTIVLDNHRTRGDVAGTALRAGQAATEEPLSVRGRFACEPESPRPLDRFRERAEG